MNAITHESVLDQLASSITETSTWESVNETMKALWNTFEGETCADCGEPLQPALEFLITEIGKACGLMTPMEFRRRLTEEESASQQVVMVMETPLGLAVIRDEDDFAAVLELNLMYALSRHLPPDYPPETPVQ